MATNRKKQDERNLKILRNLVSLGDNKQCFDCSQRGPTYVNTTIGSFVCTKCSGLLRGLTPPHRVKSISMASFTTEEIESLKNKGNDYCRKVWLALYDSNQSQDTKDEQHIQDFMIDKYEKRRYYIEPSATLTNGVSRGGTLSWSQGNSEESSWSRSNNSNGLREPWQQPATLPLPVKPPPVQAPPNMSIAATTNMFTPDRTETFKFPPAPDTFSSVTCSAQPSFANFDDNPIFNSPPAPSLPVSASLPSGLATLCPPVEDKYAALKDLDSMMKLQIESTPSVPPGGCNGGSTWPVSTSPSNPFTALSTSPSNPFRSGLDLSASNGGSSTWGTLPTSLSMPFPVSWNSPSDLTVGPSKSGNPFL